MFTTGDNAYPAGAPSDYAEIYEPTWGSFREQTHPVPGNHDYLTEGAAGYVDYFGAENVTNDVDGGLYYAWDVGNGWRAYALNSEISAAGAQLSWLRDDVAAHAGQRYILYVHRPRYTSSAKHGPFDDICPLWDALAATGGLEIVLAGHNHQYERFEPMDCAGRASADGARSFVIGSGGASLYDFGRGPAGQRIPQRHGLRRAQTRAARDLLRVGVHRLRQGPRRRLTSWTRATRVRSSTRGARPSERTRHA